MRQEKETVNKLHRVQMLSKIMLTKPLESRKHIETKRRERKKERKKDRK